MYTNILIKYLNNILMIEAILDIMQMICKHTPTIKYRYIGIVVLNFEASPLHFPTYNV